MELLGLLATLSTATTRRIFEVGFLIGAIGALLLALGHLPRPQGAGLSVAGGLLLALGLGLAIIAMHFGQSPWNVYG
jgi:hypothetical protein